MNRVFFKAVGRPRHYEERIETVRRESYRFYIFRPTEGVAHRNLFEQEFINSFNFSGIPPHKIVLKIGTPIVVGTEMIDVHTKNIVHREIFDHEVA
ncbi:LOW QUALITY PROTEIN: Helitron helicase, partial [Phytophthora megakarya]